MKLFLRWLRWVFLVLIVQSGCMFLAAYYKNEFAINLVIFFSWFYLICSIGIYIGADKMDNYFKNRPLLLHKLDLIYDALFIVVLIGLGWWFTGIAYIIAMFTSEAALLKHTEITRENNINKKREESKD